MSRVAKLVLGLGLLIAIGAVVVGFTVPVGPAHMACSGALASSHPGAEQIAKTYGPGSIAAAYPTICAGDADAARPGYFVVIVIGAIIAFVGLLLAAKKPKFTPVATELASLATLRDQGDITQAEFDAQKQRLLGNGSS